MPYVAKAVQFNGVANVEIASLNSTDNGKLFCSFWVKKTDAWRRFETIWQSDSTGAAFNFVGADRTGQSMEYTFESADRSGELIVDELNTLDVGQWDFYMFGCDNSAPNLFQLIKNGVDATFLNDQFGTPFTISLNGLNFLVGDDGFNDQYDGCMCDFRLVSGSSYLNGSGQFDPATIALFYDNGSPVDPAIATAALGTPTILYSGDATSFPVNQGDGGVAFVNDVLTTCTDAPGPPAPTLFPTIADLTSSAPLPVFFFPKER